MSENDLIVFDTETTGIPDWKQPSHYDIQPHLVEIAAVRVNPESRHIEQKLELMVSPDGWTIPDEVAEIHGITTEKALENGLPEKDVLDMFLDFWAGRKRIAFNTTFDNRIIRIATKRFSDKPTIAMWKGGEYECAMYGSRRVMGGKIPSLAEAYRYFIGGELDDAHTAMGDVLATVEIYFKMKDAMNGALLDQ